MWLKGNTRGMKKKNSNPEKDQKRDRGRRKRKIAIKFFEFWFLHDFGQKYDSGSISLANISSRIQKKKVPLNL